ncbi:2'-5' RNA ligase family protein [Halorussus salilacus]|uniref:2'-5' RNA ligase family protein n=1 Tax=Halorussus salilacus TaxID=2953750 RepID=UPI00209CF9C3|nr:2'-5' RNA ligase family protein [Halorussus salilacus]USZ66876.1 2'-5' RNA ligase family protein [Halorussus salilacus]
MYSVGVPIPGAVERLAEDLRPLLLDFDSIRDRHTLVCKRLGEAPPGGVARLREQVRTALVGAPAFEARISGIDYFEYPTRGEGPVVYLDVESPGLLGVHDRLIRAFSVVDELEGDDYTPHVTLARGGSVEAAERLADREIAPVTWTVSQLLLWDATYEEAVTRFSLPA